jgi:hypothetical protein
MSPEAMPTIIEEAMTEYAWLWLVAKNGVRPELGSMGGGK